MTLAATAILSNTDDRTLINTSDPSLDGYTHWRWVHPRRLNASGSGNLCLGTQVDGVFLYDEPDGTAPTLVLNAVSGGTAFGAPVSLKDAVAPRSRHVLTRSTFTGGAVASGVAMRPTGYQRRRTIVTFAPPNVAALEPAWIMCSDDSGANPRAVDWRVTVAGGAPEFTLSVAGFKVSLRAAFDAVRAHIAPST